MNQAPEIIEDEAAHPVDIAEAAGRQEIDRTDPLAVFEAVRGALIADARDAARKQKAAEEAKAAYNAEGAEKWDFHEDEHKAFAGEVAQAQENFRSTSRYVADRLGSPTPETSLGFGLVWDVDTTREESYEEDGRVAMDCRGRITLSVQSLPAHLQDAWAIATGARQPGGFGKDGKRQKAQQAITAYITENADQLGFSFAIGGSAKETSELPEPTVITLPTTPELSDFNTHSSHANARSEFLSSHEKGLRSVRGLTEILSGATIPRPEAAVSIPEPRSHEHDDDMQSA